MMDAKELEELRKDGLCPHCQKKCVTCFGQYEGSPPSFACDDCCGHGGEDGHCEPVVTCLLAHIEQQRAEIEAREASAERLAKVYLSASADRDRLRAVLERITWQHACSDGQDYCVDCGAMKLVGHKPDCCLKAALSGQPELPVPPIDQARALRAKGIYVFKTADGELVSSIPEHRTVEEAQAEGKASGGARGLASKEVLAANGLAAVGDLPALDADHVWDPIKRTVVLRQS